MRLLVFGDVHIPGLDVHFGRKKRRSGDALAYKSLRWLAEMADEHHVDRIVCLGDVVNSNASISTVALAILSDCVPLLATSKRKFYCIVGTHEYGLPVNALQFLSLCPDVTLISSNRVLSDCGVKLSFVPSGSDTLGDLVNADYTFAHVDVSGSTLPNGFVEKGGFIVGDTLRGTLVCGHYHSPCVVPCGRGVILYCGSLLAYSFRDAGLAERGALLIDTDARDEHRDGGGYCWSGNPFAEYYLTCKSPETLLDEFRHIPYPKRTHVRVTFPLPDVNCGITESVVSEMRDACASVQARSVVAPVDRETSILPNAEPLEAIVEFVSTSDFDPAIKKPKLVRQSSERVLRLQKGEL